MDDLVKGLAGLMLVLALVVAALFVAISLIVFIVAILVICKMGLHRFVFGMSHSLKSGFSLVNLAIGFAGAAFLAWMFLERSIPPGEMFGPIPVQTLTALNLAPAAAIGFYVTAAIMLAIWRHSALSPMRAQVRMIEREQRNVLRRLSQKKVQVEGMERDLAAARTAKHKARAKLAALKREQDAETADLKLEIESLTAQIAALVQVPGIVGLGNLKRVQLAEERARTGEAVGPDEIERLAARKVQLLKLLQRRMPGDRAGEIERDLTGIGYRESELSDKLAAGQGELVQLELEASTLSAELQKRRVELSTKNVRLT